MSDQTVRRGSPRFAIDLSLVIRTDDLELTARSVNISKGGLCCETSTPVTPGHEFEIELILILDAETSSEPLTITARSAWSTPINDMYQLGFQFLALDEEQQLFLDMFLRYLDRA